MAVLITGAPPRTRHTVPSPQRVAYMTTSVLNSAVLNLIAGHMLPSSTLVPPRDHAAVPVFPAIINCGWSPVFQHSLISSLVLFSLL
jgi:hypothetical protein